MTKTSLKKLTSIALAVLMLLSVFAVSASAADTSANGTGDGAVYLDASGKDGDSSFSDGGAVFYAYTWTNGEKWTSGTKEGNYIRFDGLTSGENVIFVRCDPNGEAGWSSKWNQTGNLTVDNTLFTITSWSGGTDGNMGGSWSAYQGGNPDIPTQGSVADTTQYTGAARTILFTDNQGWGNVYVHYFGGSTQSNWPGIAMMSSGDDGDGHAQFTANIPADSTGVVFTKSASGPQTVNCDISDADIKGFYTDGTTDSEGHYKVGSWGGSVNTDNTEQTDISQGTQATTPTVVTFPEYTTAPVVVEPSSVPSPTEPAEDDEDTSFYVSAKSNVNTKGSKLKVTDDNIQVSYVLKTDEKIDDGQFSVSYDAAKLSLNPLYNTASSMFPVASDASYNLNAGTGVIVFNFSGANGKYDFTEDGRVLVKLVFTKKSEATVGTATVYLNICELASRDKNYVEENSVKDGADVSVSQEIKGITPEIPTESQVPTAAENNLTVRAASNLTTDANVKAITSSNVKLTFNLQANELISYGDATVTFDSSKLALESRFNTYETMFSDTVLNNTNVSYRLNISDGVMKFTFTGVGSDRKGIYDFTESKPVITLMFTVKAGAEGTANVALDFEQLGSIDTKYIDNGVVVGGGAGVMIMVEGENATQSSTDSTIPPIATGVTTSPTSASSDTGNTEPSSATSDTGNTEPSSSTSDTGNTEQSSSTSDTGNTEPSSSTSDTGATEPSSAAPSYPTSIKAAAENTKIYVGKTTKVSASVTNGVGKTTFTTSNSKVATVKYSGNVATVTAVSAGTVTITAKNNGEKASVKITVIKRANTLKVTAKKLTVKAKAKKTVFKKTKAFKISGAKGKLSYKKKSGSKLVTINKKTGKITVKKGLKKGKTYTIKFNVRAAGDKTYKAKSKTVSVKIKVK